jgi:beta-glucanase (GH16 family)
MVRRVGVLVAVIAAVAVALTSVFLTTRPTAARRPTAPRPIASGQPLPSATPVSTVTPHGPPGDWAPTFDDEFNGTELDTSRWSTCSPNMQQNPCSGWGGELETYDAQNVSVSGGSLHLTARHEDSGYTSGMVSTYGTFSFEYGYMEVSMKVPAGQGLWPAAWAFGTDLVPPDELDDIEVLGGDPHTALITVHYPGGQVSQHLAQAANLSAGYHTFGLDWEPHHLSWYIDGNPVSESITDPSKIPHKPMFLLLDLAVGGDFGGPPNASTSFPASMGVNYIRVFEPAS